MSKQGDREREAVTLTDEEADEMANNIMATGALHAIIAIAEGAGTNVEVENPPNPATNQLVVRFGFLDSPYRITVERIIECPQLRRG
jgi:hypothetical protein